jgi:hypothetical protein
MNTAVIYGWRGYIHSLYQRFPYCLVCDKKQEEVVQGALKKQKLKATYIWQIATKWARCPGRGFVFIWFWPFLWRFCAFLNKPNKGSPKTPQTTHIFFGEGEAHVNSFLPKNLREKTCYLSFFPLLSVLSRFWLFFCMRSSKTPCTYFLKSDKKISKSLKKK